MKKQQDTTALITGASSGIGLELARILARDGYDLIVVARQAEILSRVAEDLKREFGISVTALAVDLSLPSAPGEIYDRVRKLGLRVGILVNNAGFGSFGPFSSGNLEQQLQMNQVNIQALTALSKLFLEEMLTRREGKILNVASTAAFQPGPMMAVYYASKAYVLSFSLALNDELRGSGVTVTTLCPGPTKTAFQERAGAVRSNLFRKVNVDSAASVAQAGYRGMMKGKSLIVPGAMNRLFVFAARVSPRALVIRVIRYYHKEE